MKKERLVIEKGTMMDNGISVFESLELQLYEGEIIGLVFDSVIERKGFHKIIVGNEKFLSGKVFLNSVYLEKSNVDKILKKQITLIDSKSMLIETLSVIENIFLFIDKRKFLFSHIYLEASQNILTDLSLQINLLKPVNKLTVRERVIVEIIKSYVEEKKVVVLSGIAGFLKRNELEDIYQLLERLCGKAMSFIVIESVEDIIFEKTSRLYIVQQGRTTGIVDYNFMDKEKLYRVLTKTKKKMVQETVSLQELEMEATVVMEWKEVSTSWLNHLSFRVERGEILKIFYLDDTSCEQILDVLKGKEKIIAGRISLNNRIYNVKSIAQAMKRGIGFVEESPYKGMLFYDMSVRDNLNVALAQKSSWIWAKRKYIKSVNLKILEYLDEEIASTRLRRLKPEMLQRIAYFRWLLFHPKVLVILKPFVEADIHIREVTIEMIHKLQEEGITIIILTQNSSELNMFEGENIYIRNGNCIDEDEVYQTLYGII